MLSNIFARGIKVKVGEVPVAFLPVRFVVLFDSSSLVASLEGRISTGEREIRETHATRPSSPSDTIDSASLLKVFRTSGALCRDRKYKCGRRSQGNGIASIVRLGRSVSARI